MRSRMSPAFREQLRNLPGPIAAAAEKAFHIWRRDRNHPSIEFKLVKKKQRVWSARISLHWRALAAERSEGFLWFWIGSHAEYDRVLKTFK